MEETNNYAQVCGTLDGPCNYSHTARGERYFVFPLAIERLSGATDRVNVLARESLIDNLDLENSPGIGVQGEIRSFNNRNGSGSRLVINVFARKIFFTDDTNSNYVVLNGTICKAPVLRITPMGRKICDLMLAVNRHYGRSDYLPCIAWGSTAQMASTLEVGDTIALEGRIQSREYIKNENGRNVVKTAFEISAVNIAVN